MNQVYGSRDNMLGTEEGEDTAVKCRERRRQRMAMRRMAVKRERHENCAVKTANNPSSSSTVEAAPPPAYGTVSVIGRRRQMVDEVSVHTNLCRPEINGFQPVHFFGVFDGHVSTLCKENMHVIMMEEMMRVKMVGDESNGGGDGGGELWRLAVNRSFHRMDAMAVKLCSTGMFRCNPKLSLMGSTAVVSVITKKYMLVAKCGDSGAVICREGKPLDLKAADEGSCGGRIMSRPIGFWATSEPDISVTKCDLRDEYLILGSNGLWDVVSGDTASNTVRECLGENGNLNVEPRIDVDVGSKLAATLLARLALGRRSADNISVIVVDLRK